MLHKEKRATITLSFSKDNNKKQNETGVSLSTKEMLAERQRQLKEKQQQKLMEQKLQREAQEKEKLEQKILLEKQKKEQEEREQKKQEQQVTEKAKQNQNFNKQKNNDKISSFDKNNLKKQFAKNTETVKKIQEQRKQELVEKKNNEKKQQEQEAKKKAEQQHFENIHRENNINNSSKKTPYKENKNKSFDNYSNDDENNNEKTNKKNFKDKSEKFMNNLHTFIFNDDGELAIENGRINNVNKGIRGKKKPKNQANEQPKAKCVQTVNIPEFISVSDLADRMNEKKSDLVKKLFTMGVKANINQIIDADTAELLVEEFGHHVKRVSDSDVEKVLEDKDGKELELFPRSPVVTVMGHVDHGKTSLLDALRSTKVAEGEYGGITQHIGASRVEVSNGKFITFIDTPGHEAFTEMRMRGANITDIVVLVVAADDGIQNQTIEAINHTKAAGVPMIVAINKIDKPDANPDIVKQALLQYNVVVEDFGGDVMCVPVSAKNRLNLDKLMEAILLQAEILDLKAPIDCKASGAVIESKMDPQKGVITTLLVQKGTLKIGDIILAGTSYGRVKKMVDDKMKVQEKAYPSMAVKILGFDSSPSAGDVFNVVSTDKEARDIVSYREKKILEAKNANRNKTVESLLQTVKNSNKKQLAVILKTDVSGSIEAIVGSLTKLDTDEVVVNVIHSAVGIINESDINLAKTSNAVVIGFNVRSTNEAKNLAKQYGIDIKYYSIIYDIIDDVKALMSGLLNPISKEEIIGQAEIRSVIKVPNVGKIAGCYITEGEVQRNAGIRLIRDGVVIFTGKIKTLRRFKDDVKEVKFGFECGIAIENYDDIKEKDIIECYKTVEEKRSL